MGIAGRALGLVERSTVDRIHSDHLHRLSRWWRWLAFGLAVAMALFHIVIQGAYAVHPWILTAGHFFFASALIFLLVPTPSHVGADSRPRGVRPVDILFILISTIATGYIFIDFDGLMERSGVFPTALDIWIGCGLILVVLETTRRTAGLGLPILAMVFMLYGFIGELIPGSFGHSGFSFERIISFLFSPQGIYGVALNASALYVYLFILFGALLEISGGSQLFIDIAKNTVGRYRGGAPKMSMVSSALFGTVSGSSVANVVLSGVLTIPMMKKAGLTPARAAAIEAVNSVGGQLVPPVMGIAAFLMADILGVPYSDIMIAAIIPAFLYYVAAYFLIDFMAAKQGIPALRDARTCSFSETMKQRAHLLVPLFVLVYSLVILEYSPIRAALYAMLSLIVISWFQSLTRIGPIRFLNACYSSAQRAMVIVPTCATAGIVVGILMLTGLGMKVNSIMLAYSFGSPLLALIIVMIITLILGMGMPTVAAYAIGAAVAVPALVEFGISPLAAHFFVFYFAVLSGVTPPIALAAFTAATIANASLSMSGLLAFRYCLAGFLIPYIIVYAPSILLDGPWSDTATHTVSATFGVVALVAALEGWLLTYVSWWWRAALAVAALSLVWPGSYSDLIGYVILACAGMAQLIHRRKLHKAASAAMPDLP